MEMKGLTELIFSPDLTLKLKRLHLLPKSLRLQLGLNLIHRVAPQK